MLRVVDDTPSMSGDDGLRNGFDQNNYQFIGISTDAGKTQLTDSDGDHERYCYRIFCHLVQNLNIDFKLLVLIDVFGPPKKMKRYATSSLDMGINHGRSLQRRYVMTSI